MGGNRSALLFAAAASLLVVVVAARGSSPVPSSINDLPLERGLPFISFRGSPAIGARASSAPDPGLVVKVVVVLVVVMAVLAIVLAVLGALRRRRLIGVGGVVEASEGVVDSVPRFRLKEAVEQARDVLARTGGQPGDAVIAAWVTLENATEHTRAPHQTATEFTVALLTEENADEDALRELRTLYQHARFGRTAIPADGPERARSALDRILVTIR